MAERRLSELEGEFFDLKVDGVVGRALHFLCPACGGLHSIVAPISGRSPFDSGAMWSLEGTEDIETATLRPSIDCSKSGSCSFHGFVTNGSVTW